MSEAMRSGDRSDEEVDLVAFNGYPDLPDEVPNPPRRHRVAAVTVAALAGIAAMVLVASIVPSATDLFAIIVVVAPLVGVGLLTLAAWDHLVEHRSPQLGSGQRDDRIGSLADRIAMMGGFIVVWLVPTGGPVAPESDDVALAIAGILAAYLVTMLVLWVASLGVGRAVQRRWGDRPATLALVFAWVFLGATLLGGLWPSVDTALRTSGEADVWVMADGTGLVCRGIDRDPCERRATLLLTGSRSIHPEWTPDYVEIGGEGGDSICSGEPGGDRACWRVD